MSSVRPSMVATFSLPEIQVMKPSCQKSRPAVLVEFAKQAVRTMPGGVMAFADKVAEHYLAAVPEDERRAPLKPVVGDLDQMDRAQRANRQTVSRYIAGEVRAFPSDLEESWVLALPAAFQEQALRELAARYGLLAAHVPTPGAVVSSLGDFTMDVGRFMQRMAPITADGKVDASDLPHIKPALQALSDLMGELASMQAQLTNALPDESAPRGAALRVAK